MNDEEESGPVAFPEMAKKAAVTVVAAPNTVAAALPRRRQFGNSPLAGLPFRVEGWPTVMRFKED